MSLYTITDVGDMNALLAITYKISMILWNQSVSGNVFRVNGKQDASGVWYYFNPNKTMMPKEVIPTNGTGITGCYVIIGAGTTTKAVSGSCDTLHWPVCEFDKVEVPTTTTAAPSQPANATPACGE
jgi:hypothetical protein